MLKSKVQQIDAKILDIAKKKLDRDFIKRATLATLIFAIAFGVYSITSFVFLKSYIPNLSFWDNLWPRLTFNSLPLLGIYYWLKKSKTSLKIKGYVWTLVVPLTLVGASLIYVWPLVYYGNKDLYLHVHAANIYIISLSLILTSPTPRYNISFLISTILLFIAPILFLLSRFNDHVLFMTILNDFIISTPVSSITAYISYKVYRQLAILNEERKKDITPFLGAHVTTAIYENRKDLLDTRVEYGYILVMDIRNYTYFKQKVDSKIYFEFMQEYHSLIARRISNNTGYVHKSSGDGHLSSFGIMDYNPDLSDVPGIIDEEIESIERKKEVNFINSLLAIDQIIKDFEELKNKHKVTVSLNLGMALSYGEINILVRGDKDHRQELDLDGKILFRCSRLEAYTKVIMKKISSDASILVVSPELEDLCLNSSGLFKWEINSKGLSVRDFPEIKHMFFKRWSTGITNKIAA